MSAHKLRLHYNDGRVITEPLIRTALANGLHGAAAARKLVACWVRAGDLERRPDGGYTVLRARPRPDTQRVAEALKELP